MASGYRTSRALGRIIRGFTRFKRCHEVNNCIIPTSTAYSSIRSQGYSRILAGTPVSNKKQERMTGLTSSGRPFSNLELGIPVSVSNITNNIDKMNEPCVRKRTYVVP